jgi:hypothetical protein
MMNSEFIDLIKKFKKLEKEKLDLIRIVDEQAKACEVIENEF